MIKRLKWNVLHGGGDGVDSDGGLSSSSEEEQGSDTRAQRQKDEKRLLQELLEQDPQLVAELRQARVSAILGGNEDEDGSDSEDEKKESSRNRKAKRKKKLLDRTRVSIDSSDEEDDEDDSESEEDYPDNESNAEGQVGSSSDVEDADGQQKFAEWRECQLCPGKRFLNDAEVEAHLGSRKHKRALQRFEKDKEAQKSGADLKDDRDRPGAEENDASANTKGTVTSKRENATARGNNMNGTDKSEAEKRAVEKKKKAAKRRLKRLKQRKWEREQNKEGKEHKENSEGKDASTEQTLREEVNEGKDGGKESNSSSAKKRKKQRKQNADKEHGAPANKEGSKEDAPHDHHKIGTQAVPAKLKTSKKTKRTTADGRTPSKNTEGILSDEDVSKLKLEADTKTGSSKKRKQVQKVKSSNKRVKKSQAIT